jgi:CHASE2 domain/CHAT domain
MMLSDSFRLKVQKIDQICLFELSWGTGQQLNSTLHYPVALTESYEEWRRLYISFYKTAQMPLASSLNSPHNTPLRGRALAQGSLTPTTDWHTKLVEAETRLLNDFHRWLRSAELFSIRAEIARYSQDSTTINSHGLNVFLTCTPLDLARFPWEAWEISTDFAATGTIRIVRTPANIRTETTARKTLQRRGKARILTILGDDTGLNFQLDREAVRSMSRIADIHFVGWQPGQTPTDVKEQIQQAIAHEQGWDVLFFAGHSNETQMTGGELAVAPNISILVQEIAPQLVAAKERGLQFAIFNSCSGLSIAESLIGLGLSQVAVMREPIHNRVAQEFLVRFLQTLANHHDVRDALLSACQMFRLEKNLTYPSAYLIPSLFCHPGAKLFRIERAGWKRWLKQSLPTRLEAVALTAVLLAGIAPPIQQVLLDQRVWLQSFYRDVTQQLPPASIPPIALVQIDQASTRRDAKIGDPFPISRQYLADLIDHLSQHNAQIIGVDYLLDRRVGGEATLQQSIRSAVLEKQTWLTFGTQYNLFEAENIFTAKESGVAEREWSLQGHVSFFPRYVTLPYPDEDCLNTCPFAYLLSVVKIANRDFGRDLPKPQLENRQDLRTQLFNYIRDNKTNSQELTALLRSRLSSLAAWSYERLGIIWLEPIIDYSIPPDRIYDRIAAWRVMEQSFDPTRLSQQVVIIGGGEYTDGEESVSDSDQYSLPSAVQYWRDRLPIDNNAAQFPGGHAVNQPSYLPRLTGAETHAYMVHHLLNQRLVIPIPDLWLIGVAAVVGKLAIAMQQRQLGGLRSPASQVKRWRFGLMSATAFYGLLSLQLYISAGILLPFFLPSITIWLYFVPSLTRNRHA